MNTTLSGNVGPHQPYEPGDFLLHTRLTLLKDIVLLPRAHHLVDGDLLGKSRGSLPQTVQKSSFQSGADVEFGYTQADGVRDCLLGESGPTMDDQWYRHGLVDGSQPLQVNDRLSTGQRVDVADGDGQCIYPSLVDETRRFMRIGQTTSPATHLT